VEILFVAATSIKAIVLRHEADALFLRMTKVYKKIETKNGAIVTDAPLKLLSSKFKI
jgi:hypothetical protein